MTTSGSIDKHVAQAAEAYTAPDGKEYRVISRKSVSSIARSERMAGSEVEIAALSQGIIPRPYFRNMGTMGLDGQVKLLRSTVAVAGAGGLGGTVVELLARCGVGHIVVIDDDRFSEEDLNRQLLSAEDSLGKSKAMAAAERANAVNSAIRVTAVVERISSRNAKSLLQGAHVVVDGLDSLPSRFVMARACRELGIPLVHGAIAGLSGQVMTVFPGDAGLGSVYGSVDEVPNKGIEVEIGTPSATPAMVAAWQVQEVIKIITGIGTPVRNQLLVLDAEYGVVDRMELRQPRKRRKE